MTSNIRQITQLITKL